jgi:hypothetical protein
MALTPKAQDGPIWSALGVFLSFSDVEGLNFLHVMPKRSSTERKKNPLVLGD